MTAKVFIVIGLFPLLITISFLLHETKKPDGFIYTAQSIVYNPLLRDVLLHIIAFCCILNYSRDFIISHLQIHVISIHVKMFMQRMLETFFYTCVYAAQVRCTI